MTALPWIRAGWGAVLLITPHSVARTPAGPLDARNILVARILGVRQLVQAAATGSGSSYRLRVAGIRGRHHSRGQHARPGRDRRTAPPARAGGRVVASGFAAAGYAVTRRRRIDTDIT